MKRLLHNALTILIVGIALQVLCYIIYFSVSQERIFQNRVKSFNKKILKEQQIGRSQLYKLQNKTYTEDLFSKLKESDYQKDYSLLYFSNDSLKYWTNKQFDNVSIIPRIKSDTTFSFPIGGNRYLLNVLEVSDTDNGAVVIPLYKNHSPRELFRNKFPLAPKLKATLELDPINGSVPIFGAKGEEIAYLLDDAQHRIPRTVYFLWILSLLIIFIGIILCYVKYKNKLVKVHPILVLLGAFYIWRYIAIKDSFNIFSQIPLFRPDLYANRSLAPSLGILFLTSVIYVATTRLWYKGSLIMPDIELYGPNAKWMKGLYLMVIYAFCPFILVSVFQSILIDSNIYLDLRIINNLDFNSFIAIITVVICIVIFHFFTLRIIRKIKELKLNAEVWAMLFSIASLVVFIVYNAILQNKFSALTLLWSIVYLALVVFFLQKKDYVASFAHVVFITCMYSLMLSLVFDIYQKKKTDIQANKFISKFSTEIDPLAEFLLNENAEQIMNNGLVKRYFTDVLISENLAKRTIETIYLRDVLSNYDAEIEFNKGARPKQDSIVMPVYGNYSAIEYSVELPIDTLGTVNIFLEASKIDDGSNQSEFITIANNNRRTGLGDDGLSFAVLDDDQSVYTYGSYPYIPKLGEVKPNRTRKIKTRNDYVYLRNRGDQVYSLRVEKKSQLLNFFTLFSYAFCMLIFFLIVVTLWRTRFMTVPSDFFDRSVANRIQFAFLALLFLTTAVIGIFSINYVRDDIKFRSVADDEAIIDEVIKDFNAYRSDSIPADITSLNNFLETSLNYGDFDLHAYDKHGKRSFSSDQTLFAEGVWPDYIDPKAFRAIRFQGRNTYNQTEYIGDYNYEAFYKAFRNEKQELQGVVFLPDFKSTAKVARQISFINVTLFNVFTYVLLIATLVSLIVTRFFTNVLSRLRAQLSQIKISEDHEPLTWGNKDEIGTLIDEYNSMLRQVENSAFLLARTERESAWRDLAKQVAHEIKNPLTPMRLSIQHLKRTYAMEGAEDQNSLKLKTMDTLIAQIDHLTKIADDFSSLAKTPLPKNQKMDLKESIEEVVPLFKNSFSYNCDFVDYVEDEHAWVHADPTMLNRILNNLLKNAEQALVPDRKGKIEVILESSEQNFLITVKDNGKGIPRANWAKIFTPNFTTKSAGTGIGLMMTKKIIELANGEIWFESTEREPGTKFFVMLPRYLGR
ncbi:MAG: hypothetical protein KTR13_01480 [Saprospiraceae bacterium]|nr:hypothetical protein [Saprospiraceae bacterium]